MFLEKGVLKKEMSSYLIIINHGRRRHSQNTIFFMYFDVSSCKVNVIHGVETVRSLCCYLLRENRKEHKVTSLLCTHGKRRCALCIIRREIIRVAHITPLNNRGKSGSLHVITFRFA